MYPNIIAKGLRILKEEGLSSFLERTTRYIWKKTVLSLWEKTGIRQYFPKTGAYQTYNRVAVEEKRIGDNILLNLPDNPSYEKRLVEYIRKYVQQGDTVVVIGGYYGVSTVAATTQTGDNGSVITFEATPEGADRVRKTTRLNDVQQSVDVRATSVGPIYNSKGRKVGNKKITPDELPDCDVLAIDCDGCELEVLDHIEIRPRMIIVEHHGQLYGNKSNKDELDFEYQREVLDNILLSKNYIIIDEFSQSRTKWGFDDHIGWFVAKRDA